ncbi:hypothetical protein DFH28DRAFT_974421 [Melampsora americana]|nr:hypothetical protein DFH28DRAFT_974421 [Melampsora americana]
MNLFDRVLDLSPLHQHLENEKVDFIQFAFRWINCLLMRELSTKKIIKMWDTYLVSFFFSPIIIFKSIFLFLIKSC